VSNQILRPNAEGDNEQWSLSAGSDTYALVDEETSDGDSTYIYLPTITAPDSVKLYLRLGTTNSLGSELSLTSSYAAYDETISRPGGGSWSESDLSDLKVGIYLDGGLTESYSDVNVGAWPYSDYTINSVKAGGTIKLTTGKGGQCRVTQLWVDVDYTASGTQVKARFNLPTEVSYETAWHAFDYAFRKRITFDPIHGEAGADYTVRFNLQTGDRQIVASDGAFNESIQASGGFQLAYWNGKTYYTYLGRLPSNGSYLPIMIVARDWSTGEWSDPVKVCDTVTSYDTHHFPCIAIDDDGYVHVFVGAHGTAPIRHYRTENPGDISTWHDFTQGSPGDKGITNDVMNYCTYPAAIAIPKSASVHGGRLYCIARGGPSTDENQYSFAYTDNRGKNWSSARTFIFDAVHTASKMYCYGIRFDADEEVLHIAFTFQATNVNPLGIWYAYSKLGETDESSLTDEGFNIFRWADGTVAGRTKTTGDQVPITYDADQAILLSSAVGGEVFVENLVLARRDGTTPPQPVVFWEQKQSSKSYAYAEETGLMCARWSTAVGSSGSWNIYSPSEQTDQMLRVRRSGIGVMTDRDGTIRLYMPVNGITWGHRVPDADEGSANVTPSTGSDNYAVVDDGWCQLNMSDYVDMNKADGYMEFSSTDTLSDATIISVDIVAHCIGVGGSGQIKHYLNDGSSVDKDGMTLLVPSTSAGEYKTTWTTNPYTNQPWKLSEFNTIIFGIKSVNATYGVRCYRLYLRARYLRAADEEWYSAEIHELQSADGGVTWTYAGEHSRNTALGVPIMTQKHSLDNDVVEVGWCSGFDLFYLTTEQYGKMLPSADDVRIFWGSLELDRVIDYANYENSQIMFQLPQPLAKYSTDLTRPLYLYYGNKDATPPPADPNNVFAYYESFEDYAEATDLNGQGGWSTSVVSAKIHQSPPGSAPLTDGHSNKIYAGGKSVRCTGSGYAEQTLGNGLTNCYLEGALWAESSAANPLLRFVDANGHSFGAGAKTSTSKVMYDNDGTLVESSLVVRYANYNEFAVQVTDAGCSAYYNGQQYVDELEGITSVDKLRLVSSNTAYFDYLRLSRRLHRTTDETLTSGFTDGSGYFSYPPDPEYLEADMKHNFVNYREVQRIELTVKVTETGELEGGNCLLGFYLSNAEEYDKDDIDRAISGAKVFYEAGSSGTKTFIFDADATDNINNADNGDSTYKLPTVGTHSFKVQMYEQDGSANMVITQIVVTYKEQDITVVLGSEEYRGAMLRATIQAADTRIISLFAKVSGYLAKLGIYLPTEYSGRVTAARRLPTEHSVTFETGKYLPVESGVSVVAWERSPVEYLQGMAAGNRLPVDYLAAVLSAAKLRIDYAGLATFGFSLPIECGTGMAAGRYIPVEYLVSLAAGERVPLGYGIGLAAGNRLPVEYAVALLAGRVLPVEYGGSVVSGHRLPVESAIILTAEQRLRTAYRSYLTALSKLPTETLKAMAAELRTQIEFGTGLISSHRSPVEHLAVVLATARLRMDYAGLAAWEFHLPFEYGVDLTARGAFPTEWLSGMSAQSRLPIATLSDILLPIRLPLEYGVSAIGRGYIPVDYGAGMAAGSRTPVEYLAGLADLIRLRIDYAGLAAWGFRLPIEYGVSLVARGNLPTDYGATVLSGRRIPVESLGSITVPVRLRMDFTGLTAWGFTLPLEILVSLDTTLALPTEYGACLTAVGRAPIDVLAGMRTGSRLPTDFGTTVAFPGRLPAEYLASVTAGAKTPIEYLLGTILTSHVPIEYSTGVQVTALSHLPIEWLATITPGIRLPVDYRGNAAYGFRLPIDYRAWLTGSYSLPVEFGKGLSGRLEIPIEYLQGIAAAYNIPIEIVAALALAAFRAIIIGAEDRYIDVPEDIRTATVGNESRLITIPASTRTITIPLENREVIDNG
jgi:hypothetical protein